MAASVVPPGVTLVAPSGGRLLHYLDLTEDVQLLFNPLGLVEHWNTLLVRHFGFTLTNLLFFLVTSFFFWKILVLFILPGIYFRVMLYTDEMDADRRPIARHSHVGWSLVQILDATVTNKPVSWADR